MAKHNLRIVKADGKRAAVYLRKSTDEQAESITQQRKAVMGYASRNEYSPVAEYVDAGISGVGSSDRRPQFQQLVADAKAGKFDVVLLWDLSRITRSDPMETSWELVPLRRLGVRICTTDRATPIDWDTFAGQLLLSVEAESNNAYVRKLARNTCRGQYEKAKQGLWVAGRPPLGYKLDADRRLQLGDQGDVALIRFIFAQYYAGIGLRPLVALIQQRGHKCGISWVRRTLQNPRYVGDFVWGEKTQAKFFSVHNDEVKALDDMPEDAGPSVYIRDNHPAIIDRGLFDQIQATLGRRRRISTPLPSGGAYILTGLLRCGSCGYAMTGKTSADWHGQPGKPMYYCTGHQSEGVSDCHSHAVSQSQLIDRIVATIEEQFSPQNVRAIRKEITSQLSKQVDHTDVETLRKREAVLQAKLDKAAARLVEVDRDLLDVVQEQVRKCKAELADVRLATDLAGQDKRLVLKSFDQRIEAAIAKLKGLRQLVQTSDAIAIRAAMQQMVKLVRVHVDQVPPKTGGKRCHYTFRGGELVLQDDSDLLISVGLPQSNLCASH